MGEIADDRELKAGNQVESSAVAETFEILIRRRGDLKQRLTARFYGTEHFVGFHIAQYGGLDSAVAEVEALSVLLNSSGALGFVSRLMLELSECELDRLGIAELRDPIDDRASGIAETKQLRSFVECFTRRVIAGVSNVFVVPAIANLLGQKQVGVSAADDQGENGNSRTPLPFWRCSSSTAWIWPSM